VAPHQVAEVAFDLPRVHYVNRQCFDK
jgi:hypothetical protein